MRLDEMYYTEIEMEGMKEILRDKEEENKKLEKNIAWYEKEEDRLREENKKLKAELAFKNTMLDNVKAEYDSSLNIIRNLNRRIKELEQCNLNLQTWIDNKEKVNKSLREENKRLSDFLECEA